MDNLGAEALLYLPTAATSRTRTPLRSDDGTCNKIKFGTCDTPLVIAHHTLDGCLRVTPRVLKAPSAEANVVGNGRYGWFPLWVWVGCGSGPPAPLNFGCVAFSKDIHTTTLPCLVYAKKRPLIRPAGTWLPKATGYIIMEFPPALPPPSLAPFHDPSYSPPPPHPSYCIVPSVLHYLQIAPRCQPPH